MDFVHTIEDEATRRLSYEGAMHELHTILAEGMITGEYINQDVPEEERIILGTTFVPSASYGPEWGDAEAWKMPGTVGPNSEITLVAPGGVSGVTGPDGRPKGINYSFVGIFVAIALLTLFMLASLLFAAGGPEPKPSGRTAWRRSRRRSARTACSRRTRR